MSVSATLSTGVLSSAHNPEVQVQILPPLLKKCRSEAVSLGNRERPSAWSVRQIRRTGKLMSVDDAGCDDAAGIVPEAGVRRRELVSISVVVGLHKRRFPC